MILKISSASIKIIDYFIIGKDCRSWDLLTSQSRGVGRLIYSMAFVFDKHHGSITTEMPLKFQSGRASLNTNIAASRIDEILRKHVISKPHEVIFHSLSGSDNVIYQGETLESAYHVFPLVDTTTFTWIRSRPNNCDPLPEPHIYSKQRTDSSIKRVTEISLHEPLQV